MRALLRSMPPTRVAPRHEGAGSSSRMLSDTNPTSTQSSMVVNRSIMARRRVTMSGKRSSTRPTPSALVLCTTASKRSTCSPLV